LLGLLTGLLTACGATSDVDVADRRSQSPITLPDMNLFSGDPAPVIMRTNTTLASDFMALAFELESGRKLPVLSRFETPVTVRVTGNVPSTLAPDLQRLLARLRNEAGIDIRQIPASERANITIEVVNGPAMQRMVPNAACFVAPRVSGWAEFRSGRRRTLGDWTTLRERKTMSIFLPDNVSPQEVRDCLHEELAQTLGPVNDMYQLADSVFNDDNFHTVLTGFDMMILRIFYDPRLRSGMTPEQVAARLPEIITGLNPSGGPVLSFSPTRTPPEWKAALTAALGGAKSPNQRRKSAARAVAIARAQGWTDNRMAFSLFAQGRLALANDSTLALASFLAASEIYNSNPNTRLHAAYVAVQTSAYALSTGQPQAAVDQVNRYVDVALQAENASLLATLLMIKSEALRSQGKTEDADIIRLDSLGWARYGIGSEQQVRRQLAEIAALAPRKSRRASGS